MSACARYGLFLLKSSPRTSSRKLITFYTTRSTLALASAAIEARFITTVSRVINPRCAWFLLLIILCNAGMWSASVALLPSSFTMYTTTLALSYAFDTAYSKSTSPRNTSLPSTTSTNSRVVKATCAFALGALLGWPFALVLAGPFVFEEVALASGNLVRSDARLSFILSRTLAFVRATLIASAIAIPIFLIDSVLYGKATLVPLNIIVYNILSSKRGAGPELYGVEPPWFYLANLALNVGPIVLALSLAAVPALALVWMIDARRVTSPAPTNKDHADAGFLVGSSPLTLLTMRTLPFYIWLGLLSLQPHKEERFMFPALTALCFNAALSLEIAVGLLEKSVFAIARKLASRSKPSRQSQPGSVTILLMLPNLGALAALVPSALFSLLRIVGTLHAYNAPFTSLHHLNDNADVFRDAFLDIAGISQPVFMEDLFKIDSPEESARKEQEKLQRLNTRMNVCYGKEWYRFPNSFFLPDGFQGQFIRSEFRGILPKHFPQSSPADAPPSTSMPLLDFTLSHLFPRTLLATTRTSEATFNDLNQEEMDRYVDPATDCHILIDTDPCPSAGVMSEAPAEGHTPKPPPLEPYYARDTDTWDVLDCLPFMDSEASKAVRKGGRALRTLARILYIPQREQYTAWKRFCLMVNKSKLVAASTAGQAEDGGDAEDLSRHVEL